MLEKLLIKFSILKKRLYLVSIVFIDNRHIDYINLQPLLDSINAEHLFGILPNVRKITFPVYSGIHELYPRIK